MIRLFTFALLLFSALVHAEGLETAIMPGKVIQGHAKYEDECTSCHKRFDKAAQDGLCMDCHKDVGKDVSQKKGFHGRQLEDKDCRECHTEHKGRAAKVVSLNEKTFKHDGTDFALKGGHAAEKVKCEDCHKSKVKWRDAPHACFDCHKKDDDKAHKGNLGKDCAKCHSEKDWKTTSFDHAKTDFDLKGKHVEVKCKECHVDNKYKDTPTKCFDCHKKDDTKAHKGVFGTKCETCHGERSWKDDIRFDHDQDTKFDLRDKHREAKCASCHKTAEKLKTTCISCHKKDDKHNGTLGEKCEECHGARDWKSPKGFNHDQDTKFPLKDKHKEAKCDKCHTTGQKYEQLPLDCWSCHKKEDEKAHKGNFGKKCGDCHKENDWKKSFFNHDKDTKYPLRFKHFEVKCDKCHTGKLYEQKLKDACYGCHKKTDDDKGHRGNLGEKCEKCHNEKSWKGSDVRFDHDKDTKYPLKFKHKDAKCEKCHTSPVYRDKTPSDCYACHKKDDKHNGQEGKKCEDCHNERSWKGEDVRFDHNKSKFPLLGKHIKTDCKKCHETPEFKNAKSDCYSCHKKEDKHELRLGTKCDSCHNARDWKVWDFDHDRRTKYKLDGAHKKAECTDCHRQPMSGDKVLTPNTCAGCHDGEDIHEGGFGKQCERCHVTSSFKEVKPRVGR